MHQFWENVKEGGFLCAVLSCWTEVCPVSWLPPIHAFHIGYQYWGTQSKMQYILCRPPPHLGTQFLMFPQIQLKNEYSRGQYPVLVLPVAYVLFMSASVPPLKILVTLSLIFFFPTSRTVLWWMPLMNYYSYLTSFRRFFCDWVPVRMYIHTVLISVIYGRSRGTMTRGGGQSCSMIASADLIAST